MLLRTGLLLGTKTLASAVAMRLGPGSMASHQILYQVGGLLAPCICWRGEGGERAALAVKVASLTQECCCEDHQCVLVGEGFKPNNTRH